MITGDCELTLYMQMEWPQYRYKQWEILNFENEHQSHEKRI